MNNDDPTQQLLRYAELLMKTARKAATADETAEMEKIRLGMGLSEEEILKRAEEVAHKRY